MLLSLLLFQLIKKNRAKNNINRGFTLIELLLSLSIGSILVISVYSILNFTANSCKAGDIENDILLNGRYVLEYIKREIKSADKIISTSKFNNLEQKYKNNIGFVIVHYYPNNIYKYNYITYYFKNNKVYRIATERSDNKIPDGNAFSGNNEIGEYVKSIEGTKINYETKLIDLSFTLKRDSRKEYKFKSKLYIRCPVVY